MRVVRNTFRLQYTNFILKNDSGLGKDEKIKCFISLLRQLDKEEGTVKQYVKKTLA